MIPLPCWMLMMSLLAMRQTPAGTHLHVRLQTTVGSYATKAGTAVDAVLIAPAQSGDRVTLPVGSIFTGQVKMVRRVGLGIPHETAALQLDFNHVMLPDGERIPVSTRVIEVDNARETVNQAGRIQGLRATNSPCYRVSGYIRKVIDLDIHARLASWAIKSVITQLPEPEIYFPAGVELTLTLTEPLLASKSFEAGNVAEVSPDPQSTEPAEKRAHAGLMRTAAAMPIRTSSPTASSGPADLTNVLLVGSREEISAAFAAAGWAQAKPMNLKHRISLIRATSESHGYRSAPMTPLLLNGAEADMSWEKTFNDVSKRHHIRLWRQPGQWHGKDLWIGAATRDIQFAYLRPGQTITHRVEPDIDRERERIAYDLSFTSCVNLLERVERPEVPQVTHNATGDTMTTDTRLVVIGLNDCRHPRPAVEGGDGARLPVHGNVLERLARREILSARNDALRGNLIWRSFEVTRWMVRCVRQRHVSMVADAAAHTAVSAQATAAVTAAAPASAGAPQ